MSLEKIKRIADLEEEKDRLYKEYQQKLKEFINEEVEKSKREFKELFEENGFKVENAFGTEDEIIASYKNKVYKLKESNDGWGALKFFDFIANDDRYIITLNKQDNRNVVEVRSIVNDQEERLQKQLDELRKDISSIITAIPVYTLRDQKNEAMIKRESMKELLIRFFEQYFE